jgi:AcrR family transcriptional regulator
MSSSLTLADRHSDLTESLILSSAIHMLERSTVSELTVRAVAKHAHISERTVFRYFASRDHFLDAVAKEVASNLNSPPPPLTLEELIAYPRALYTRFEEKANLTKAALHSELVRRIRDTVANERWKAVRKLIDAHAGRRSERDRKLTAANIRYFLAATTWYYYRFHFNFTLEETIDSAQSAVRALIEDITEHA